MWGTGSAARAAAFECGVCRTAAIDDARRGIDNSNLFGNLAICLAICDSVDLHDKLRQ